METMAMIPFDAAVAEYLHADDRARPWTRRQEADALDGLAGWLRAEGSGGATLGAVTKQVVSRYAAERRLGAEEIDDLHGTLACLRLWARAAHVAD